MAVSSFLLQILVLFSNTGIFSSVVKIQDQHSEENCVMSFVIPRDKVKSSCDIEEKVNRQLNSMEVRLNMYRREVNALQNMLQKERQVCHDKIQALEGKLATLDSDSRYYNLEKKLESLEKALKKRPDTVDIGGSRYLEGKINNHSKSGLKRKDWSSEAETLTSIVKPIVISEIENYLANKSIEEREKTNAVESNEIVNNWPRNDQSYVDDVNVKVNESKTREIIEELETLQEKLNKTGDELVSKVGGLLKNVTIKGQAVIVILNNSKTELQNSTRQNDTEIDIQDVKSNEDVIRKKNKISSRLSVSEGGDGPQNDQEHEEEKVYVTNLYTEQLEELLRGEINNLLQSRMEEVISLMTKQSSNLAKIVNHQGNEIDQLEESNEEDMKGLQDKVEGIKLEMSSLSTTVQELYRQVDRMQGIHVIVEELKKNMTTKAKSVTQSVVTKVDEQGKRLKALDRFQDILEKSLQHYRNESKVSYFELRNKLSNIETTLARDVTTDLFVNITSKVGRDIQRFNNTLKSKVNSMEAAIRNLEDSSVLYQMDLKTLERQHKSKTGKLEANFGAMKNRVDRINNQNRRVQDTVSDMRTIQKGILKEMNATSASLESLNIEFKLSVTNSWVEYNFTYDTSHTACFGQQYIRRTKYQNARLAGVVLCDHTKYKIMLANSVTENFVNVGDVSGFGEDHCEFVGASYSAPITLSPPAISMKTKEGFARESWGQEPERKNLNFLRPSPAWYKCGVNIP